MSTLDSAREEGHLRELGLGTTGMQQDGCKQNWVGEGRLSVTGPGISTLQVRMFSRRGVPSSDLCFKSPHFVLDRPGATLRRGPSGCRGSARIKYSDSQASMWLRKVSLA